MLWLDRMGVPQASASSENRPERSRGTDFEYSALLSGVEGRRGPESELEEDAEEGESVAPDIAPEATICMYGAESCELTRRESDEAKSVSRVVGSPPSANCFSSPLLVPK